MFTFLVHVLCYGFIKSNSKLFFFVVVACFTCTPDSIELVNWGAHGTDVSFGARLLSGETFLQVKNSTGTCR